MADAVSDVLKIGDNALKNIGLDFHLFIKQKYSEKEYDANHDLRTELTNNLPLKMLTLFSSAMLFFWDIHKFIFLIQY